MAKLIAFSILWWTLGAWAEMTEMETFEDWEAGSYGEDVWLVTPVVRPSYLYVAFGCLRDRLCVFVIMDEGTLPEGWERSGTPVVATVDRNPPIEATGVFRPMSNLGKMTKDVAERTMAMVNALEGGETLQVSIGGVGFVQSIAGLHDASMWAIGRLVEFRPVRTFGDWTAHIVRGPDGTENEWYVLSGDIRLRCRDGQIAMAPFADSPEEPASGKLDIEAGDGIRVATSGDYPNRIADFTVREVMGLAGRAARARKHDVRVTITDEDGSTTSYLIPTKGYRPAERWVERKCKN
ncbi:MAG: hypothetical protein OXI90_13430 [Gammaproteobacteria bacterium]|nr:hypothetical protein [Gammaproteobacteria bacterium]